MTNQVKELAAALREKLAAEGIDPEQLAAALGTGAGGEEGAGEAGGLPPEAAGAEGGLPPEAGAEEAALAGGHAGHDGEISDEELDQLIQSLTPEQLAHLEQMIAQEEGGHPGHGGPEDVADLSQQLEGELAQHPEASSEGLPPEKAAALDFVKSASYIEGFLNQAIDHGFNIKTAVDLYDQALTQTIHTVKQGSAAEFLGKAKDTAIKAYEASKPVAKDAYETAKRVAASGVSSAKRFGTSVKENAAEFHKRNPRTATGIAAVGAGTVGVAAGRASKSSDDSYKYAAYYEGIVERAREYGIADAVTLDLVKSAMAK